jgi:L-lactate dehydrogenase complex protein LldE
VPTVALFVTCVADQLFPDTGMSAVRLLEAAGETVVFPDAQTCCGQPALAAGEPESATRLARHFLSVFAGCDAVVAPSGSCAAMTHHWYARLVPDRRAEAEAVAAKTYELAQYLVEARGATDLGAHIDDTVTMHDACHGLRHLGVKDAARMLLEHAGATVVEMREPETCCGFGGVFAQTYPEVSTKLADAKLADAGATGARWLVSSDLACLMHLEGRRRRVAPNDTAGPTPIHFADLLARGLP